MYHPNIVTAAALAQQNLETSGTVESASVREVDFPEDATAAAAALIHHRKISELRRLIDEDVHNVVRFDCRLAHAEELNMRGLIAKVREAIIDTVNAETEWFSHGSRVHATGGRGNSKLPLHRETIEWDFS